MSTYQKDYIIDCLVLRRSEIQNSKLKELFLDHKVVKIFHGCDTDMQLLASDLGILVNNLFDTARAYLYLQRLPQILDNIITGKKPVVKEQNFASLEIIVRLFLSIELDKFF
jgi:hypothetical protein